MMGAAYHRERYKANREKKLEYQREYWVKNKTRLKAKRLAKYVPVPRKEKPNTKTERSLLTSARHRAKTRGLEFNLCVKDLVIPEYCPVLGIPIIRKGGGDNAPSLDRIDNALGYTRGNIKIISWRANRIKSDATIADLKRILAYAIDNEF